MQMNAYMFYNGNCEAAFEYYVKVLGGEINAMFRYEGTPAAEHVPADWQQKIMHAKMTVDGDELMGSDAPPDKFKPAQGCAVVVHFTDPAEADRKFAGLAEGGVITMPLEQTFWASRYGMCIDKFGVPWIVNCA